MKRLSRRAGKRLVLGIEKSLGAGPYARIERLNDALRNHQQRVVHLQKKVNRQQRQIVSLKQRVSSAEQAQAARAHLLNRETWDTESIELQRTNDFAESDRRTRVEQLLDAAWSGWWEYGKDELRSIATSRPISSSTYDANIALAELDRAESNPKKETEHLQQAVRCRLPRPPTNGLLSRLAYMRIEEGDLRSGIRLIASMDDDDSSGHKQLLLSNAMIRGSGPPGNSNNGTTSDAALGLNPLLLRYGFSPVAVAKRSDCQGLPLMVAEHAQARPGGPLVSILLPAYNCASTLSATLYSLLAQTWQAIEVIVVDDASTDDTQSIARHFMEHDNRVHLVSNAKNSGAYVARNRGLAESSGEFVTVCDAGDWVHPERIEHQVLDLLTSGTAFNWTQWIRADESMVFHPRTKGLADFVHNNPSSLMFRRAVFEACGEWDAIRVSGDTEFRTRVQEMLGIAPRLVAEGCPLSIGILDAKSLTQTHGTNTRSRFRGVRRDYLESISFVRRQADLSARLELRHSVESPFVVRPRGIQPTRPTHPQYYDLLVIGDFSDSSCESAVMLRIAERGRARRSSVGLIHLPSKLGDAIGPSSLSRVLAADFSLEWVNPGETVSSTFTVTTDSLPSWHSSAIDEFPNVSSQRLWIVGRSRLVRGRFDVDPRSTLGQSIAAYFPRLSKTIHYMGDVAPYVGRNSPLGDSDISVIPSARPLKTALASGLSRQSDHAKARVWRSSTTAYPEAGTKLVLLQCERCSDEKGKSQEALSILTNAAAERGLSVVVPSHLQDPFILSGSKSKATASLRQDSGSLADRVLGETDSVRGGIYWPSNQSGIRHCWEPILAAAEGLPVVGRALYEPVTRFVGMGQPFDTSETIGDAIDALAAAREFDGVKGRPY